MLHDTTEEGSDDATTPAEENKTIEADPKLNTSDGGVSPEILASDVKVYIEEELKTPTEEKPEMSIQNGPKFDIAISTEESEKKATKDITPTIEGDKESATASSTDEIKIVTTEANVLPVSATEENKNAPIPTSDEQSEIKPTKSEEPPTNWDELGIKFVIIPTSRYHDIVKFCYENFYPDEPISRSTGLCQPGGPENKMMDKFYVKDALKHGVSMMATDKDDKIVAIRIGKVIRRTDTQQPFNKDDALLKVTSWVKRFLPKEYSQFFLLQKLFDRMGYDVIKALDQLKCDVLYEDSLLATSKTCRLKGLGTELVRRSFEIAEGAGCEYIYTIATGEYSAKIFSKLGFTLDHEHLYNQLKDKSGNKILKDTREHTKARIFFKKLKSDSADSQ